MHNILFRGKRVDNGEWVYGAYYKQDMYYGDPSVKHYIITSNEHPGYDQALEYFEVKPETVGRYIEHPCYDYARLFGAQRIFEGDIIEVYRRIDNIGHAKPLCVAIAVDENSISENGNGRVFTQDCVQIKVIGNVHDNPDLIGEMYAKRYINGYCLRSGGR